MALDLKDIINSAMYSLSEQALEEYRDIFDQEGVLVLPDFIGIAALEAMVQEAQSLEPLAYHNSLLGTAYLQPPDLNFPEDHPKRKQFSTALAVLAYDQIPPDSAIRSLYHCAEFTKALEKVTGFSKLFEYQCPLGKINIAVMREGDHLRWHFDQSEFVVSVVLQQAEEGGEFEYVPNTRDTNSPNYEGVSKILEGDRSDVKSLLMPPGSLVLFRGMNTLHRVSTIHGSRSRLVALLGYVLDPQATSTDHLRMIRYGRTQ